MLARALQAPAGRRGLQQVVPEAQRGTQYFKNYTWLLPLYNRRKGMAYIGDNERLRVALSRYMQGARRRSCAGGGGGGAAHSC